MAVCERLAMKSSNVSRGVPTGLSDSDTTTRE